MRRLFFALPLVFGAFAANAQESSPIKLELGGFTNWYVAASYNEYTPAGTDYNRFDVMGDAEIYFKGTAQIAENLKIGVMAQLEGGTDSSYKKRAWDEVYMYVDSLYGRLFLGDVKNAGVKLTVLAPSVSVLAVDDGFFDNVMPVPAQVTYLNSVAMKPADSLAPKVMYFSPSVNGVMFGVSAVAAGDANGHDASVLYPKNDSSTGIKIKNGVSSVLRYDFENNDESFGAHISATYSRYEPNDVLSHPLQDYTLGVNVSIDNWTIGGAVRRAQADARSAFAKMQGYMWEAGVMYDASKWAASVNVLDSRVRGDIAKSGDDRYTLYVASYKYRLGAGIDLFAETAYAQARNEDGDDGLSADAFSTVAGFSLSF